MSMRLDIGIAQIIKDGEELCGDSVEVVHTENADIVVMSDGMGSGVKANILSQLTVKTAATMLKMGGEVDEVIETLVQTLPICQVVKMAYSTFSIAKVLHDGRTYLAEYDNPTVFVGRGNTIITSKKITRKIADKQINEHFIDLKDNCWMVIVSDGVLHAGLGMTMNMGWGWKRVAQHLEETYSDSLTATEWADNIIQMCNGLYGEKPGDDATAVVLKMRQLRHVTVLIGPPQDEEDDELVVEKLMCGSDRKVVCGGTTSNIVGRVLGCQVSVDLSSNDKKIPPLGMLPGIDLVTEGAVTLVYALEHIKYGTKLKELKKGKDGASKLAALLVEADEVHFIVGLAENPALQGAAGLPAIYTYKHHVVRDLINVLKVKGKKVVEEYY